jgi:hypothetical protein
VKVFIGYDIRQPIAFQVLAHSIWSFSSKPVEIVRLDIRQMPIKRTSLTEFTYSRYCPPYLMGYEGTALFLDADMLLLDDIWKLDAIARDMPHSVCLVKNKLRFEWPSLMYFHNERCRALTPELIETGKPQTFDWAKYGVGELPPEWNHCIGYDTHNPNAKLAHYTAGVPCWPETKNCRFAKEWATVAKDASSTVPWADLMAKSVHAELVTSGRIAA